jgi:hypothetical protein
LRAAAHFSATPQNRIERGFAAGAGPSQFMAPTANITRRGDDVSLVLHGSPDAAGMALVVPAQAKLQSVTLDGGTMPAPTGQMTLFCGTPGCAQAKVILHLATLQPVQLLLMERRYGLPVQGLALAKARGVVAVPSQSGDMMILASRLTVPGN